MNDITTRFLDTYKYLLAEKIIENPKNFANELNVSTSLITEICKKRTNAGITPIQNLLKRYNEIDANWLLTGEGSMLKANNTETNTNYKELADARLEIIDLKNEIIELLKRELTELKGTKTK
ncbi:hypothetical protein [Flavobacterium defluvii]|uniref:Bacteriophage CI repressor helix-turn-helix domain-containing protein n=1 Tax=Flavobacterium defluvii TaxID=370979 RepID=A0A1M5EN02_9FLAO|nr:hypothetical protein [Flavobacterium defluvii]SHF80412.1 hypothetical protein SAMN05443663_101183 [Flavobacterium defluvii]